MVGTDAHSSIVNTLRLLEMDALVVETPDHRLTAETVLAAIDGDPDVTDVVAVICTSGTTNAGIVDDLAGVGAIARERGWWFHVDGAYGGSGIFARSLRHKYDGIEQADSFILDPHKWLFTPFDCCSLLYRDPELARATHTQDASYLDVIHTADGEWNPTDYAYHLTRRARGLPLWFSLAVNGVDAYREAIETAASLALRDRRADQGDPAPGADPGTRPRASCCSAGSAGSRPTTTPGRRRCTPRRSPSSRRANGRARRSAGSRSCTRTPRWNWSRRSSTGPPERPERRAGGRRRRAGSGQRWPSGDW